MTAPADPPGDALAQLARWPTRLRLLLVLGAGLMVVALTGFALGEPAWQGPVASVALAVLVVAGIGAQVAVRCPRCNRPVPLRSGLRLPERCPSCELSFLERA